MTYGWITGEVFTAREGGESCCASESGPSACTSLCRFALLIGSCIGGSMVFGPASLLNWVRSQPSRVEISSGLSFAPSFPFSSENSQPWVMACNSGQAWFWILTHEATRVWRSCLDS